MKDLIQKFTAAVRGLINLKLPEFPEVMNTMMFQQAHAIPYTGTKYGWSDGFHTYTYNTPRAIKGTHNTIKYTWHEARRVADKDGFKYTLHAISEINPALNGGCDRSETRYVFENNRSLATKKEALAQLEHLEKTCIHDREKIISLDAKATKCYFQWYKETVAPVAASLAFKA